ncbi:proline dehydrogenase [Photobacterium angustum]|uniref:aldehyde dehydrogenase family protein n=1 Tax=Photobacterium angustum TaxID=661 RepID=UPI0005DC9D6A|nr:aldehyde dehydrogenase family protein [Photobacterium angustum]KJF95912.1 proline dehydrogenase [Photobacterium angustum]KJG06972.1 proline dehydrogenase [Photobacterium angustum]
MKNNSQLMALSPQVQKSLQSSIFASSVWNDLDFETRIAILRRWAKSLDNQSAMMVNFQCNNALEMVAEMQVMPGPTGESNTLYCVGRGVFVVTASDVVANHVVIAQIATALVCGNSVMLCLSPDHPLKTGVILSQLEQAGCVANVLSVIDSADFDALIQIEEIAAVAYSGTEDRALSLARQLAARSGQLAQLVAETDLDNLPVIGSPSYCLRFITERTRTINITAVGGNATLLELGCGETD